MKLTKEQVLGLFNFLNILVGDETEIKHFGIMGDDILIRAEPVEGEIENRAWRITQEGKIIPSESFFYD